MRATPRKLYHLGKDVGEANDLTRKEPAKVKELEAAWQKWSAEMARPLWGAGKKGGGKKKD